MFVLLEAACAPALRLAPEASSGAALDWRTPAPIDRGCPVSADHDTVSAIRSSDGLMRSLLAEGCRRSPTLRRLATAIGHTDGVVYLGAGRCPIRALRGCLLHTIQDTGNARYLWILVTAGGDAHDMVATMAHELQHALEVLARADVRSQLALVAFYRSHESRASSSTAFAAPYRAYETSAALDVAAAVRAELASTLDVRAADDRD